MCLAPNKILLTVGRTQENQRSMRDANITRKRSGINVQHLSFKAPLTPNPKIQVLRNETSNTRYLAKPQTHVETTDEASLQ